MDERDCSFSAMYIWINKFMSVHMKVEGMKKFCWDALVIYLNDSCHAFLIIIIIFIHRLRPFCKVSIFCEIF
jgi:hypothetical protein